MGAVCVFGSLNIDHTLVVERLPKEGETLVAREYTIAMGGKGFNQAVTAARQGAKVTMVGCVGDDEEGDWLIETLAAESVITSFVVRHATLPTGRAHITVTADGANTIVVGSGANAAATFPSAALDGTGVLLAQLECPLELVGAALLAARRSGLVTVLNAAPAMPLRGDVLELADYLIVNEAEEEVVGGSASDSYPGTLITTLGSNGAVVSKGGRRRHLAPVAVESVVDPTGAGDAFCGALAAGLASGRPFGDVLARAAAAGAHAVTIAGAFPSLPRSADVDTLLDRD